jgi:hypothetical protein
MTAEQVILAKAYFDSISLDATHRSNRFGNPLSLIVGVDCHFKSVILATMLHYYEDGPSFAWFLQQFKFAIGKNHQCAPPPHTHTHPLT